MTNVNHMKVQTSIPSVIVKRQSLFMITWNYTIIR